MGLTATLLALVASNEIYTAYPVFGDTQPAYYSDRRVQVVTDKGPTRELIVSCGRDETIIIHDVADALFIDAKNTAHRSLNAAIARSC